MADVKLGRNTKLTKHLIKKISEYISQGNPFYVAAALCGVSEASFYKWKAEGIKLLRDEGKKRTEQQKIFVEFIEAIKKAEAEAISRNVKLISEAAQTTWQAAAWYLERRHPEDFGKKERHEITGAEGTPLIPNHLEGLTAKERRDMAKMLAKARDD